MVGISKVCWLYGIAPSTLRRWESEGIVPKPKRTGTGLRDYSSEDIETLKKVIIERNLNRETNNQRLTTN
jgi:DNA-binding transcriptional MerR regulator